MIRRLMFAAAALGLPFAVPLSAASAGEVIASGHMRNTCLDMKDGRVAIVWSCHGGWNQSFQLRANSYGQLRQGNRCLSTDGGNPKGKALVMVECRNVAAQRWGNPSSGRLNNEEGWCADIANESRSHGAQVIAWDCGYGKSNQRWRYAWGGPAHEAARLGRATLQQANAARWANPGAVIDRSGRIVAAGAGNIVAVGAGNIVAVGAGNIVAVGAGN